MADVSAESSSFHRYGSLWKLGGAAFLVLYFGSARWMRPEQWFGAACMLNGTAIILFGTLGYRVQRRMIAKRCRQPDMLQASRTNSFVRVQRNALRRMFHSGWARVLEGALGIFAIAFGILVLLFL